jgi:hypothetical protein
MCGWSEEMARAGDDVATLLAATTPRREHGMTVNMKMNMLRTWTRREHGMLAHMAHTAAWSRLMEIARVGCRGGRGARQAVRRSVKAFRHHPQGPEFLVYVPAPAHYKDTLPPPLPCTLAAAL